MKNANEIWICKALKELDCDLFWRQGKWPPPWRSSWEFPNARLKFFQWRCISLWSTLGRRFILIWNSLSSVFCRVSVAALRKLPSISPRPSARKSPKLQEPFDSNSAWYAYKLSLYLNKHHAMNMYWRSGDVAPRSLWPRH